MNTRELIKLIIHQGGINKDVYFESFFIDDSFYIPQVFKVLQEIDSTVYKYHFPIDYNFLIEKELLDKNNKKSIFTSSTTPEIMLAKKYTMNKLNDFFQKVRIDPFKDQIYYIATRLFIRDFVYQKMDYLDLSFD
tara:strand:- start:118 stop:522 length:405 start_codon:yes stop_codon:yes gene_type:complete